MRFWESDKDFLLTVMKEIESKARILKSGEEICNLVETVGLLRDSFKHQKINQKKESVDKKHDQSSEPSDETDDAEKESKDSSQIEDESNTEEKVWDSSSYILQEISSQARKAKSKLTASEIRRVLAVYSLLPFQADSLIKELNDEVSRRLSYIDSLAGSSFQGTINRAQSESQAIDKAFFQESDSSAFHSIKSGLMSLFQASDEKDGENVNSQENKLTEDVAGSVHSLVSAVSEIDANARRFTSGSGTCLDLLMTEVSEAHMFEFGRCRELISHYRRVEFSTGTLKSRYDKERRKDISKRVLSRLLP